MLVVVTNADLGVLTAHAIEAGESPVRVGAGHVTVKFLMDNQGMPHDLQSRFEAIAGTDAPHVLPHAPATCCPANPARP